MEQKVSLRPLPKFTESGDILNDSVLQALRELAAPGCLLCVLDGQEEEE